MFHITWGLGQAVHQAPSNILVWLLKGKSGGGMINKYLVKKEHNLRSWGYVLHCAEIGSKSTKVSKLSVHRNWVCHIVGTPQGISKHVLEFS